MNSSWDCSGLDVKSLDHVNSSIDYLLGLAVTLNYCYMQGL